MFRWIMYLQHNFPGNQSFELVRVKSLEEAKDKLREFCRDVLSDECSATLYAYGDDAWQLSEEFRGIGCPHDYPDRIVERGPRGGVVVRNT